MTDAIKAGSIHIEEGEHLPKFLVLQSESESVLSGWALVTNIRSTLEEQIKKTGWVFFFMAGNTQWRCG
jgi:hypothetical protein